VQALLQRAGRASIPGQRGVAAARCCRLLLLLGLAAAVSPLLLLLLLLLLLVLALLCTALLTAHMTGVLLRAHHWGWRSTCLTLS
jgi:hypothetical protein